MCSTPFGIEDLNGADNPLSEVGIILMCSTPFGIEDLNGISYAEANGAGWQCSTPFGIEDLNGISYAEANGAGWQCSTPFGIEDLNGLPRFRRFLGLKSAQRLSASKI